MAFISSQGDYMDRSPSRNNLKGAQRNAIITPSSKELPLLPLGSSRPLLSRNYTETHLQPSIPAAILASLEPSASYTSRPRHKSDSRSANSSTSRSTTRRVPVPTESSLLVRDTTQQSPLQTAKPKSVHPSPESTSSASRARSRKSSVNAYSDVGSTSCAFGISSKMDMKRLIGGSGQGPSSFVSNRSDSTASHRIRRSERDEHSPSGDLRVKITTTTTTMTTPVQEPETPTANDFLKSPEMSIHPLRNTPRRKSDARQMSVLSKTFEGSNHIPTRRSVSSPSRCAVTAPVTLPSELTPAGAVAAAYKRQEQRREKLASISRSGEDTEPAASETRPVTPYYTVFGSTSGRVVAVGGPEDDRWNLNFNPRSDMHTVRSPSTGPSGAAGSGLKKLSRKVSSRWKKVAGGGIENNGGGAERTSLRESSAGLTHTRRKSVGVSIDDGFVEVTVPGTPRSIPSAKNGGTASVDGCSVDLNERSRRKGERADEASAGRKLWTLVKKISTGALKETYAAHESAPPPVPALPSKLKELSRLPRGAFETHSAPNSPADTKSFSRFVQGRSSFSGGSLPSGAPPHRNSSEPPPPSNEMRRPSTTGNKPVISPPPTHGRPSTTTRSSSPNSSDMASSKFWGRTRSARSSVSSYTEDLPPVPKTVVGQHILPLSELFRLEKERLDGDPSVFPESPTKIHKGGQDSLVTMNRPAEERDSQRSTDIIRPSLPIPPRRNEHHHHHHHPHNVSSTPFPSLTAQDIGTPTIPSFCTDEAINPFNQTIPRLTVSTAVQFPMPQAEFGVSVPPPPPPPRPARSPRRVISVVSMTNISIPTPTTNLRSSSPYLSPDEESELGTPRSRMLNRQSESSNASTTKQRLQSSMESSRSSSNSPVRTSLKYRELGASSKYAWTEKEKADRWDDLLEMSNQAGGTIHLGDGGGLLSDSVD